MLAVSCFCPEIRVSGACLVSVEVSLSAVMAPVRAWIQTPQTHSSARTQALAIDSTARILPFQPVLQIVSWIFLMRSRRMPSAAGGPSYQTLMHLDAQPLSLANGAHFQVRLPETREGQLCLSCLWAAVAVPILKAALCALRPAAQRQGHAA